MRSPIADDLKISVTGRGERIIKRREPGARSPGTLIPSYNVAIDEHPLEAPRTPRGSRQAGRAWMRACACNGAGTGGQDNESG